MSYDVVAPIIAIGSLVVWAIRQEGRINALEKQLDILQAKHDALDSEIAKELTAIKIALAEIKGALGVKE